MSIRFRMANQWQVGVIPPSSLSRGQRTRAVDLLGSNEQSVSPINMDSARAVYQEAAYRPAHYPHVHRQRCLFWVKKEKEVSKL